MRRDFPIYKPTPLPARIDLTNLDTQGQLKQSKEKFPAAAVKTTEVEATVAAVPLLVSTQISDHKRKGFELIEKHLEEFLGRNSVESNFRSWVRDFHSEYDDPWFIRNFKRLETSFKPFWDARNQKQSSTRIEHLTDVFSGQPKPAESLKDLLL